MFLENIRDKIFFVLMDDSYFILCILYSYRKTKKTKQIQYMNMNMVRTTTTRSVTNRIVSGSSRKERIQQVVLGSKKCMHNKDYNTTTSSTFHPLLCTITSQCKTIDSIIETTTNNNRKQYCRKNYGSSTNMILLNSTSNNNDITTLTKRMFSLTKSSSSSSSTINNSNDKKTEEVKVNSTTGTNRDDDATTTNTKIFTGDIIQGPAIIRTSVSYYNRPNPTILSLPGLRSLPFWSQLHIDQSKTSASTSTTRIAYNDSTITNIVQLLESNCNIISAEYLSNVEKNIPSDYQMALPSTVTTNTNNTTNSSTTNANTTTGTSTNEHTLHNGRWDWHSYMLKGKIVQGDDRIEQSKEYQKSLSTFQLYYPETTKILQQIQQSNNLFEHVPFGYTFFSTLYPQTSIVSHYGPTNLRLRLHLPILVPNEQQHEQQQQQQKVNQDDKPICGIRVGTSIRQWDYGKVLVFDDSYNHEVWNNSITDKRIILLVDMWHPDVTLQERSDIIGMFQHAHDQGWL